MCHALRIPILRSAPRYIGESSKFPKPEHEKFKSSNLQYACKISTILNAYLNLDKLKMKLRNYYNCPHSAF